MDDPGIIEELKRAEYRFRTIVEHCSEAIAVLSPEGEVLYITPSIRNVLGYAEEEAMKLNVFSLVHPDELEEASKVWEDVLATSGVLMSGHTARMKHKDGTWRWVEASVKNMIHDPAINGIINNFKDVTEKVHARKQKAFDQNNLEALINSTTDMMWSVDRDFNLITANKPFLDMLRNFSGKEVDSGANIFSSGIPQELVNHYKKYYERTMSGEIFTVIEHLDYPSPMWLQISYHPIWVGNDIIGTACHSRIITELKEAEQIRIRNEERLKESQAIAKLGHWELNFETGISIWSDETCRIYGLPVEDNRQSFEVWVTFIHPDDLEYVMSEIEKSQKTLSDVELDHRILLRDGTVKHISSKSKYEFDEKGNPIGIYGVAYDVTVRKQAEEQLKQKAKELELSNAELEQFAYAASHDLQEPLRMVTSFLTQLENKYGDGLDDRGKRYIHFAVDGAKRMRQIILDILEYSRVGKTVGEPVALDINELVEEVKMLLTTQISGKKAHIQYPKLPIINSYKTPLFQVFQNLIGNALKYSAEGIEPQIKIDFKELKNHWQFSVTDNGIGIHEEYFDKIFNIFQRLHTQEVYSGTGIGLATTKKIIERLKGQIWVESIEGEGSTFYFTVGK
ncbi:PAS domain-containing sensor histidine kinase [Negadavirga shengliensis]|uniref:histidine kinase n=1 Tax=Negadavirga shengliensis TaxID=1389218 RepID=A0ABV9T059_9BACT